MRPELLYLAAGAVAVIGATVRDKQFPNSDRLATAAIGTIILVIVVSATAGTRIEPLTRAFGALLLLVAVMAAVNATLSKKGQK